MLARTVTALIATLLVYLVSGTTLPIYANTKYLSYEVGKPNDLLDRMNSVGGKKGNNVKLIFIPGILGSKLLRSGTNKANKDYVWGSINTADPDLIFDGKNKLQSDYFDQVDIPVVGSLFNTDVYGKALLMLQDSRDLSDSDVFKFSYDWRQSNVLSARDFNKWICENKSKLQGNRIIILAHSMGGLVLKNWFIDNYDKGPICDPAENGWLQIEHVYFAGTPHFGAAKALAALFGKYSLFDNWFARSLLGDGVKKYGYSFDSFYELLPIQNDPYCDIDRAASGLPNALVMDNSSGIYPNIFDINFMEKYDLPRAEGIDRQKFRNTRLRDRIADVGSRACQLAKYQFPKLGLSKVTIFAGQNPAGNTVANTTIQVHPTSQSPELIDGEGDGTVPKSSAIWLPELGDPEHVNYVSSLHMQIPADQNLKSKLQTEVQSVPIKSALLLKEKDPNRYNATILELAQRHLLFFPPADDANLAKEAQAINADIFATNGTKPSEIALQATTARSISKGESQISYTLNDFVAKSESFNDIDKFFATNAVARELQKMGYESLAKPVYDQFIPNSVQLLEDKSSTFTPEILNQLKMTTGNAYNTRGTILEHQGDLTGAMQDYKNAIQFNNTKAQFNLKNLNMQ